MEAVYRLVMRTGPTVGMAYPLDKNEMFIGRDLGNEISINDPEISRRHARIFKQGTNFVLEDLGSTNGTLVNGQRLMGPYVLRPGELIVFGEQVSLIFEGAAADADATVASGSAMPATHVAQYPQEQELQPEPIYQPGYAGQVPAQQDYYDEPEKKKFPVAIVVIVVIVVLLICACGIGLYFIDANDMWCDFLGFAFNAINAGSCP
jgi:predicted component of type VI protein secretion system